MNPTLPRFNNIELLRFLLAWAVVGFHIVVRQQFDPFGLAALRPTWAHGWYAVDLFFTISFFFLVLKTKPETPFLPFCRDKWLRLAPLAIVSSALYYIMHRCGYCRWNWPANLETFLLIRDWAAYARWGQNLGPAWYCCAYLLIAAFYLGLIKALPKKLIPLIIGITAYLSWRFYLDISGSAHPRFGSILGTDGICRGLFWITYSSSCCSPCCSGCLSAGRAISRACWRKTGAPPWGNTHMESSSCTGRSWISGKRESCHPTGTGPWRTRASCWEAWQPPSCSWPSSVTTLSKRPS